MPNTSTLYCRRATARDLHFFQNPHFWPLHPLLPVTRRSTPASEKELGLLLDTHGQLSLCGYACTVFVVNLFFLPPTLAEFLSLPRHVYDTFDELADDGWVVD